MDDGVSTKITYVKVFKVKKKFAKSLKILYFNIIACPIYGAAIEKGLITVPPFQKTLIFHPFQSNSIFTKNTIIKLLKN